MRRSLLHAVVRSATITLVAVALGGCAEGPRPRDVSRVDAELARAPHVDVDALPAAARAEYERGRVSITRLDEPRRQLTYAFATSTGDINENEFVRRYRAAGGGHDLDDAEHGRTQIALVGLGFLAASAASASLVYVLARYGFDKGPESGADGIALALIGVLPVGTGIGLGFQIAGRDGEPRDHDLTELEAKKYVERYDQLLLQRAAGVGPRVEAPPKASLFAPDLHVGVSGAGLGVFGSF